MRAAPIVVLALLVPLAGHSAILHVNPEGTGDYPTIQAAVDACAAGDTVLCSSGTYTGAGNRDIELRGLDIAVIGESGADESILDCLDAGRAFFIHGSETSASLIQGFTIRNGHNADTGASAGGGIRIIGASPTLRDLVLENGWTETWGGGIHLYQSESTIENVILRHNEAEDHGGGVSIWLSNVTLSWLLIHDNEANGSGSDNGGGLYALDATVSASHLSVVNNFADYGGGLFADDDANIILDASIVAHNSYGGGIYRQPSASVILTCCDVYGNEGGNFLGSMDDPTGTDGNISQDPWFCDFDAGDFTLSSDSPCLPANNDCGVLMGALEQGCELDHVFISGRIIDINLMPIEGVELTGVPGLPVFSDANGDYVIDLLAGWSGIITPSHPAYSFEPPSRAYFDVYSDQYDQNYFGLHSSLHRVPEDHDNIQDAIAACLLGDTVLVAPGTYNGQGNRDIELPGFDICIIGEGGSAATALDCEYDGRGFYIFQGETRATLIEGFTIWKGDPGFGGTAAGGAVRVDGASPTLRDLNLKECYSRTWGGGLYFHQSNAGLAEDIIIEDCLCYYHGGGIAISQSSPLLQRIVVSDNLAKGNGGALYSLDSNAELHSISIVANRCEEVGGGIVLEGGTTTIADCVIAFNGPTGGGLHGLIEETGLNITCSDVWGNGGGTYGGTLSNHTGTDGNISSDPLFCDLGSGDWHLHSNSPCLPENNNCGVLMGALPLGCESPLYLIGGTVRDEQGAAMPGVDFSGLAIPLVSGAAGEYRCMLPGGWSGTLIPTLQNYFFSPSWRSYTNLQSDHPTDDYLGYHPTHVYVPMHFETIQDALDYCLDGDTVTVFPGEYEVWNLSYHGKSILLRSLSGPENTVLQHGEPVVWFGSGEGPAAVLEGFTVRDGWGGIICEGGSSPTLHNLIIEGNESWPCLGCCGAGLRCTEESSPYVTNVIFRNNSAADGGALYCTYGSSPILNDCEFESNYGNVGGAVYIHEASPQFFGVNFIDNRASPEYYEGGAQVDGYGGAVYCRDGMPVFDHCTFAGNRVVISWIPGNTYGGACFLAGGGAPVFRNCTFHGNYTSAYGYDNLGAAIYSAGTATPDIEDCIVAFNGEGGGIYCAGDPCGLQIECSDVFGNMDGDYIGIPDQTGQNGNISEDPRFCDAEAGDFTLAANSPCLPANNDCGVQMGAHPEGCEATAAPEEGTPAAFSLAQNHPNPFNPETEIRFGLPSAAQVTLRIYDASGRRVASLLEKAPLPAGYHTATWRGRDSADRAVPSGVYFYRLDAGDFSETRKMILLK